MTPESHSTWPSGSHENESGSAPWSLNTSHSSPKTTWSARQMKCARDQLPCPRRRLIRTASRGSEHFDELKPDCTNSSSAHANRAAAREQQIQPLRERVQQQTLDQIVKVLVETHRQVPTIQNVAKQLRSHRPSTSTRSWMCQACAKAKKTNHHDHPEDSRSSSDPV